MTIWPLGMELKETGKDRIGTIGQETSPILTLNHTCFKILISAVTNPSLTFPLLHHSLPTLTIIRVTLGLITNYFASIQQLTMHICTIIRLIIVLKPLVKITIAHHVVHGSFYK